MNRVFAERVVSASSLVQRVLQIVSSAPGEMGPEARATVKHHLDDIRPDLEAAGLLISQEHVDRIDALVQSSARFSYRMATQLFQELLNRIRDELKTTYCLILSRAEAKQYEQPRDKWEDVLSRFGSAVNDIEEVGRCMALNRYTAAVFHSLQVVELGLLELGKLIGVTDPKSGWTAVTKRLRQILETPYASRTDFEKKHSGFLEQVHGTIEAMKNAWRNKVDHAQGRLAVAMGKDFTHVGAEEIVVATRAFMRRLAEEMP